MKQVGVLLVTMLGASMAAAQTAAVCPVDGPPGCADGKCACNPAMFSDPVYANSGQTYHRVVDIELPTAIGSFKFERIFTSSIAALRLPNKYGIEAGLYSQTATPFGNTVNSSGARANSPYWWHSLFATLVKGTVAYIVYDTTGVSREYLIGPSYPDGGPAPYYFQHTPWTGGENEPLMFDGTNHKLVLKDSVLVWATNAPGRDCGVPDCAMWPLSRIEDRQGRTLASITYFTSGTPRGCPFTTGTLLPVYIDQVTLAGGAVLQFSYGALIDEGTVKNCRLDSVALVGQGTLVSYEYDAGTEGPTAVHHTGGTDEYISKATGIFLVSAGGIPRVNHVFNGNMVATSDGLGLFASTTFVPDGGVAHQCGSSMCCPNPSASFGEWFRRTITIDGNVGSSSASTTQLQVQLVSFADWLVNGEHDSKVGSRQEYCDAGYSCSPGVVRFDWRGLADNDAVCSSCDTVSCPNWNPGHLWATQDKRGSIHLTKNRWDIIDGGAGAPTLNIPALFEEKRGAMDFDGGGALETTQYSYVYSTNGHQYLATKTRASSLNSSATTITQNNYEPNGDALRLTGTITEGYTRDASGTLIQQWRGTFYKTQRSCNASVADPFGRTLRVEGPCLVTSRMATTCAGGLDADYPISEYVYYDNSAPATSRGQLASVTRYARGSCQGALTTSFDSYDLFGGVTSVHDENGVQTTTTYTGKVPTSRTVDPSGLNLTTSYGYDSAQHLTYVKFPAGNYMVYCYRSGTSDITGCDFGVMTDKLQWIAKAGNSIGTSWAEKIVYKYYATGELRAEERWLPNENSPRVAKQYTPDLHARPAWESLGLAGATKFVTARAFDQANNVVGLGHPFHSLADGGTPETPAYCRDGFGNVSSLCTKLEYDRANRLTTVVTDADGDATTTGDSSGTCFDYDKVGNVRRVSAGCWLNGQPCSSHNTGDVPSSWCTDAKVEYDVDDFGDVVEVRTPWSNDPTTYGVTRFERDARGDVVVKITPETVSGKAFRYSWDLIDRPTLARYGSLPSSFDTLFQYYYDDYALLSPGAGCPSGANLKGRASLRVDSYGKTWFSYDSAGRLLAEYKASTPACGAGVNTEHHTLYSYTPNGTPSTVQYPYGRTIVYNYGSAGLTDRVQGITTGVFVFAGGPQLGQAVIINAAWEPFGGLRYYQQVDYVGGVATRYRTVHYSQGITPESSPTTACATASEGNDFSASLDGTGRVATVFVSDGGISLHTAGSGNILKLSYGWRNDQIWKEEACFTGLGQTTGNAYEKTYGYDNTQQLTSVTGLMQVELGRSYSRTYGYDRRGNRVSQSIDGCPYAIDMGTSLHVDQMNSTTPTNVAGCGYQVPYRYLTYDANGRVAYERDGPIWWEKRFGYSEDGGWSGNGGEDSVYRSVATRRRGVGAWTNTDYYYDAKNRLWQRILPAGQEELRFYDSSDAVLTIASPLAADATKLVFDDHVWLDGKLIATVRGQLLPDAGHAAEATGVDCGRIGSTGPCGINHIVNDVLPKPVLAINGPTGTITGYAIYDEFGSVNRIPAVEGTVHPYSVAPDGGVIAITTLPSFGEVDARALYTFVSLPRNTTVRMNSGATLGGSGSGHVWSGWSARVSNRATITISGLTDPGYFGVTTEAVEFRGYATGATPYFPLLRFPGQYFDPESELNVNWNRFYDPSTGRYLAPEPMLSDPDYAKSMAKRTNLLATYGYALNNPLSSVDPTGLEPPPTVFSTVGAKCAMNPELCAAMGYAAATGAAAAAGAVGGASAARSPSDGDRTPYDPPRRIGPIPLPECDRGDCDGNRKVKIDQCTDNYWARGVGWILARTMCKVCTESSYQVCMGGQPNKISDAACNLFMKKYGGYP